ncbi:MAG TPA: plastocyanin/azurin family copper-binding protein, partial [Planctomycetota bacterium]|nr:plastocyanin/azurin family copper-binding protein [Planctomycetota bacterium]
ARHPTSPLRTPTPTMRTPSLAAALLLCGAGLAEAQTVHTVQLFSATFSPKNITIQVGDTVRWVWVTGLHNVESGTLTTDAFGNWVGVHDGNFTSGDLVLIPPGPYEVTFDYAFLAGNPMPNNLYPYYCENHLPGMTGTVKVVAPTAPPVVQPYGLVAPADSLLVSEGEPRVGQAFTLQLQDTEDYTGGPGFGVAYLASAPDPAFPGGTLLPGFGLGGPADPGELLISVGPPNPVGSLGPKAWSGAFTVVEFPVLVPNTPSLAGVQVYLQGALIDPLALNGIGLTNGLRIQIGG